MSFDGNRLKERRKLLGLTLDQLADASGTSKSYIWEMEASKPGSRPSADLLYRVAQALDTTMEYLLGYDDSQELNSPFQNANYRALNGEQVRQLWALVKATIQLGDAAEQDKS